MKASRTKTDWTEGDKASGVLEVQRLPSHPKNTYTHRDVNLLDGRCVSLVRLEQRQGTDVCHGVPGELHNFCF